jgi:hypothetical protein
VRRYGRRLHGLQRAASLWRPRPGLQQQGFSQSSTTLDPLAPARTELPPPTCAAAMAASPPPREWPVKMTWQALPPLLALQPKSVDRAVSTSAQDSLTLWSQPRCTWPARGPGTLPLLRPGGKRSGVRPAVLAGPVWGDTYRPFAAMAASPPALFKRHGARRPAGRPPARPPPARRAHPCTARPAAHHSLRLFRSWASFHVPR